MNAKKAREIRKRAIVNPQEKTINRKLYKKLKKEYKRGTVQS